MSSGGKGKEKDEPSNSTTTTDGADGDGDGLQPEQESRSNRKKEKETPNANSVPFYKLFAFADSTDYMLMIAGTIGAIGNGACMPLMTILFGDLIDSFGENQNNDDVVRVVSKVRIAYMYV